MLNLVKMDIYRLFHSKTIKIGAIAAAIIAFLGMLLNFGILEILKAYHDCGFDGYIRPDHGRHLWDEKPGTVRPGYGLYDRALGIMYMLGVWDMLDKLKK